MKKNVLFVVHHLTIGGVQKSLISALNSMDYNQFDITLYVRKGPLDLLPFINENVNVVINTGNDKKPYKKPISLFLYFLCKAFGFFHFRFLSDFFNTVLENYVMNCQMKAEANAFFKHIVFDAAVSYLQGPTTFFVAKYIKAKRKIACYQIGKDVSHELHILSFSHIDSIVVEHESIKTLLIDSYPEVDIEKKISIIENYIDSKFIKLQASEFELDTISCNLVLCSVGRFSYVKGFDIAAETAAVLKDKGVDFIWYFVGYGEERDRIEAIIQTNHLENYVILTGMQKNPYPYIKACDFFIQTSRNEALSIAALEASVLNKPIISTNTIGGKSLIVEGKNGVLTDLSPDDIADSIISLYNNLSLKEDMIKYLSNLDFKSDELRYKKQWSDLLNG